MDIKQKITELMAEITNLSMEEKIETCNLVKQKLHEISPFKDEPVDCVLWIKADKLHANDYNPNEVAPPEMKLLEHSIKEDGYTQPVVTYEVEENITYEVVDGFHRTRIGKEAAAIKDRLHNYLPVTIINQNRTEKKDRIAATIRHNRARGVHGVKPMSTIVAQLYFSGWSNKRISEELGMSKDEVLRLKQFTGLGTLFKNREFTEAWEM